jgi:hypothetical protein
MSYFIIDEHGNSTDFNGSIKELLNDGPPLLKSSSTMARCL